MGLTDMYHVFFFLCKIFKMKYLHDHSSSLKLLNIPVPTPLGPNLIKHQLIKNCLQCKEDCHKLHIVILINNKVEGGGDLHRSAILCTGSSKKKCLWCQGKITKLIASILLCVYIEMPKIIKFFYIT